MGQDWFVWVGAKGQVCRSAPSDPAGGRRNLPFGCRSTTDGNIGGLSIQSAGSTAGVMYSAVIPYARARVELVIEGKHLAANTVRFDRLKSWTFYYLLALIVATRELAGVRLAAARTLTARGAGAAPAPSKRLFHASAAGAA